MPQSSPIHLYIMLLTYNRPDLVIRSVQSVLNQTYKNFTLLIFNDGSTADYSQLEKIIEGNPSIQYFKSKNIGTNHSRNQMLDLITASNSAQNAYFFTLSDDDYLSDKALDVMADEIQKTAYKEWYIFNCQSKSQHIFRNTKYDEYKEISYNEFRSDYHGDKQMVFKLDAFRTIRYAERFFKNGYEHVFYYRIPFKMQIIPKTVRVIEYYDDGLSLSNLYNPLNSLPCIIQHLRLSPLELAYWGWLRKWLSPKKWLKKAVGEERYYRIKKTLGLKIKNTHYK